MYQRIHRRKAILLSVALLLCSPLLMGQDGCAVQIGQVILSTQPLDPGPWQDVTVTVTVRPHFGVAQTLQVEVAGSDGYYAAGPIVTNQNGVATFVIPGAPSGVYDEITVFWPAFGIEATRSIIF